MLLPNPRHSSTFQEVSSSSSSSSSSNNLQLSTTDTSIPVYGKRRNWKPRNQEDFADGGAYPECHLAQYPLEMGRKKQGQAGNTLSLQVDSSGNVRYDAIVKQGLKSGQTVQSTSQDLVPLSLRPGKDKDRSLDKPSEESIQETADRTRLALEAITQGKIKAAQPKHVPKQDTDSSFIRYTPGQQGGDGNKQRIIKMTSVQEDPLEPPKWKFKKVPKGPPSPPAPVLRSPPRKVTAKEQAEWNVPPCISNWKNNKGFTIALDKRLAADGRGLQDNFINDGFATFSEALQLADRHAREEVRMRAQMTQKLAAKEKEKREENLRNLAQRARDERAGITTSSEMGDENGREGRTLGKSGGSMPAALAGYGSDSDDESGDGGDTPKMDGKGKGKARDGSDEDDSEDEGAKERDRIREERKREREREMRMNSMGTEQRARYLAREQNRDISEKVALGLAKPSGSSSQLDSRLFNREAPSSGFGEEDSYNLYDKPLFAGSSAAAAIYSGKVNGGNDGEGADEAEERVGRNDRFGLGVGRSKAFEGAEYTEERSGPVQFEKDIPSASTNPAADASAFGIDQFLDDAKRGTKRAGLDEGSTRKRQRD